MVNSHNEDWNIIFWWSRDDYLFSTSLQVKSSLFLFGESTSTFTNVISTSVLPFDSNWVLLSIDLNLVAINLNSIVSFLDACLESSYIKDH